MHTQTHTDTLTRMHRNQWNLLFCRPTTSGHGSCPEMWLIYPVTLHSNYMSFMVAKDCVSTSLPQCWNFVWFEPVQALCVLSITFFISNTSPHPVSSTFPYSWGLNYLPGNSSSERKLRTPAHTDPEYYPMLFLWKRSLKWLL